MGGSFRTRLSGNSASHALLRLSALDSLCCSHLGEVCELLARKLIGFIIPELCVQRKKQ
jgi:hypothetical protein